MIEEPYRWVEAIANRREYIEDQLRRGSPVVVLDYADGLVLLTVSRETRKIFEVYDRVAFAALGQLPASVRALRAPGGSRLRAMAVIAAFAMLGGLLAIQKRQFTFSAGNHPHAVAFDGTDIWVTNESSAAVTRFRVP